MVDVHRVLRFIRMHIYKNAIESFLCLQATFPESEE